MCYQNREGRVVWNPTFKAFAEYWGSEPRVCRAYRAQTSCPGQESDSGNRPERGTRL